jgi:hypothetical protein
MAHLRQLDAIQEKKSLLWVSVGSIGLVLAGIGLMCALAGQTAAAVPILVIGVIVAIVGFSLRAIHGRLNLVNRRYEMVAGILALLSKDMAEDALVSVDLDFRPHNHPDKFHRQGKVRSWNVKFFVDCWLQVQGRFVDGTKYSISLIEKRQDRHRTKRSASGKIKNKSKTKNSSEAIVSLKFKQKRYPKASLLYERARETVQLPSWVGLKAIKTSADQLTLRTATQHQWEASGPDQQRVKLDGVNWIAMMFLSLYRLLNLSR